MVAADIDGSKMDTFGPRSGGVPGGVVGGTVVGVGEGVVPPPGRTHCWLAPPPQSQICSRVPSAELGPVASRHLLDVGLISRPALATHCWAPVPLQSQI